METLITGTHEGNRSAVSTRRTCFKAHVRTRKFPIGIASLPRFNLAGLWKFSWSTQLLLSHLLAFLSLDVCLIENLCDTDFSWLSSGWLISGRPARDACLLPYLRNVLKSAEGEVATSRVEFSLFLPRLEGVAEEPPPGGVGGRCSGRASHVSSSSSSS